MKKTEYFAAWIYADGSSAFKTPQTLYIDYDLEGGWQREGNNEAPLEVGFHRETYSQGEGMFDHYSYVDTDKEKVQLVIDAATKVRENVSISWGFKDA